MGSGWGGLSLGEVGLSPTGGLVDWYIRYGIPQCPIVSHLSCNHLQPHPLSSHAVSFRILRKAAVYPV